MAFGSGRVLPPVSRVQANCVPRETFARPCTVHRCALVAPVRKDPLRSGSPPLVMSTKPMVQRVGLGPFCPPIEDHYPEDYRISSKTSKIRGPETFQDEDRVLQRKQNPSIPEQSRNNPGRTWRQSALCGRVLIHQG